MNMIKREWQAFWLALGFLTRIPMLAHIDYSQRLMNQSSLYFPLVGLLLGALYAGLYTLLALFWSPLIGVLLIILFHLWLTGAFHEDGLADSFDGLGGGYTVAKRLLIMKDSRIGTYGSAALWGALSLKAALLISVDTIWLALLAAPVVSRLTPLFLMRFMCYVSDPDSSKSKPVADGFSGWRLALAALFVIVFAWGMGIWLWTAVAILLVTLLWGWALQRALGGYTGDALGASVVFTELLFLLGLAL